MKVVNIYVPLKYYPYLENQDDVPSPDEEDDFIGMWKQVKSGEKQYDWSIFMGLIKDIIPGQYSELFGDLPGGKKFIKKLNRFFNDHAFDGGDLLHDKEGKFQLYVTPLEKNVISKEEIIKLVKADLMHRAKFLMKKGYKKEALILKNINCEYGYPPKQQPDDLNYGADALITANDLLSDSCELNERWQYCLDEACYGIAASFELQHWLMSHWYDLKFDFETAYFIWKSGYSYDVEDNICYIHRRI
jgi:hypothetical protein